jgi:hypothetical protein
MDGKLAQWKMEMEQPDYLEAINRVKRAHSLKTAVLAVVPKNVESSSTIEPTAA